MNNALIIENMATLLTVFGVLALIVAVIVQTIKELPGLKDVPTSLVALIVSEIITILGVLCWCDYHVIIIVWYYVFGAVIAGFFVYMVATGGWDKLNAIWQRTRYKSQKDKNTKET